MLASSITSTTASDLITEPWKFSLYVDCTIWLLRLATRQIWSACTCTTELALYLISFPGQPEKHVLVCDYTNFDPRKLSMWDGDYLESGSILRLPSNSWAAPTEFMLLTTIAVKFFNPWINATVSAFREHSIYTGRSPCLFDHVDWCVCQFWLLHTESMLLLDIQHY